MMHRRYVAVLLLIFSLLAPSATFARRPAAIPTTQPANSPNTKAQTAQQPAAKPDPNDPIARIKDEGMNRSQVMNTLSYLSDVIGPRLTGSPNMRRPSWQRFFTIPPCKRRNCRARQWLDRSIYKIGPRGPISPIALLKLSRPLEM